MSAPWDNRAEVLFVLEWANISLYRVRPGSTTRAQPWGRPDPSAPIFLGMEANKVRIGQQFETSERRPSGWKFPIPRHLSTAHNISIERVWITKPLEGETPPKGDYVIKANELMFMYMTWQEPPNGKADSDCYWQSRTYYGVTGPSWNLDGDTESVAFMGEQSFSAMFFKPKTGKGAPPVVIEA